MSQPTAVRRQKRRDDFTLGEVLGHGAFGQVIRVTDKETGADYAMKVLSKSHIVKEKKMNYVKVERDAMMRLRHPNIVRLCLTFQDPGNLYYVIEYAPHGDLKRVLEKQSALPPAAVRALAGQVLLALAHMHQKRVIHRDIKPENILLDAQNRAKVTDFGTAKIFAADEPFYVERGSFVGSADFVSPEVLGDEPVGPESDLWSFGCLVYALLVGQSPFHTESTFETFQRIQKLEYTVPESVPPEAENLIRKLLVTEAAKRIGAGAFESDYEPIRNHEFFSGVDWAALPMQSVTLPCD